VLAGRVGILMKRRRFRLELVVLVLALAAPSAWAEEQCLLPMPVERRYRVEPNEDELALKALQFHLDRHPSDKKYGCLTFPGYRAIPKHARTAITRAGLSPDPNEQCHFVEGAVVLAVSGVWRTGADRYVVHVSRFRFGHVSTFIAEYAYTLTKFERVWAVAGERESPCNPKEELKRPEPPANNALKLTKPAEERAPRHSAPLRRRYVPQRTFFTNVGFAA
jgi:hypothetical protein